MIDMNLFSAKAAAQLELCLTKPARYAGLNYIQVRLKCDQIHSNDFYEFGHT
jgi:hypothetical protein